MEQIQNNEVRLGAANSHIRDSLRRWAHMPRKTLGNPKEQPERARVRVNERIVTLHSTVQLRLR